MDEKQCWAFFFFFTMTLMCPYNLTLLQNTAVFLVLNAYALLFWPISIGAGWKWWVPCSLPASKLTLSWTVTSLSSPRGWALHCKLGWLHSECYFFSLTRPPFCCLTCQRIEPGVEGSGKSTTFIIKHWNSFWPHCSCMNAGWWSDCWWECSDTAVSSVQLIYLP